MENTLEHDQDEITATGDLWKQSTTGGKLWSLRKFVLTNVYLVYYNKKGEKRGQWDISGCIVRPLTSEEAGTKAAQNAFCVAGPGRTYLLNANSSINRQAWIKVIEEQIEEFRDPDRRHLRSGEVIYGKGNLKKKNMLGLGSNVRMLLTNLPRIMIIEPSSNTKKNQISWARDAPPTLTKTNDVKFKIHYVHKELSMEDNEKGSVYWEEIFKKFPTMKYYVPHRRNTFTIDFEDKQRRSQLEVVVENSVMIEEDPEEFDTHTNTNLKFLKDAQINIVNLICVIDMKIEHLDPVDDRVKRSQLGILKDNVTVLSNNIDALMARNEQTQGRAYVDTVSIESIIIETKKMVEVLDQDDTLDNVPSPEKTAHEEDVEDTTTTTLPPAAEIYLDSQIYTARIEELDRYIEEMEEEQFALDDMIANVEVLNFNDDMFLYELEKEFNSIRIPDHILITSDNYSAKDRNHRPAIWKDIRKKRVLLKEYVDRVEGVPEETIRANRAKYIEMEEDIMVHEVDKYGGLMSMEAISDNSIAVAAVHVTDHNFDPDNTTIRPAGWRAMRLKRVIMKEEVLRNLGVDEDTIVAQRPGRVAEEENLMVEEIRHNQQLNPLDAITSSTYSTSTDLEPTTSITVNEDTFNPFDTTKRPMGWNNLRLKRVLAKEQSLGGDRELLMGTRPFREVLEEDLMVTEVLKNGAVGDHNPHNTSPTAVPLHVYQPADHIHVTDSNYDADQKRPTGWTELRNKRVLIKEQTDRSTGLTDMESMKLQAKRMEDEECRMHDEVMRYGHPLNIGPPSSKDDKYPPQELKNMAQKRLAAANKKIYDDVLLEEMEQIQKEIARYGHPLGFATTTSTLAPSTLILTADNFHPLDPSRRPPGWQELKNKRVLAKEKLVNNNKSTVDNNSLRPQRLIDEEECMIKEAIHYLDSNRKVGNVLDYTADSVLPADINLDKKNFDPSNPSKRPLGWEALRKKRVLMKERIFGLNFNDEDRDIVEREEEKVMLDEYQNYGQVYTFTFVELTNTAFATPLVVNKATFDSSHTAARPAGWKELKLRRILEKERIDRQNMSDDLIYRNRPVQFSEEEDMMCQEVMKYGQVLTPMDYSANTIIATNLPITKLDTDARPEGWDTLKQARVLAREQAVDSQGGMLRHQPDLKRIETESTILQSVHESTVNPFKRVDMGDNLPRGWNQVRDQRVGMKTEAASITDTSSIAVNRRKAQEEKIMLSELENYGLVIPPTAHLQTAQMNFDSHTFDPNDPSRRPPGWSELRTRRVQAKEKISGANNVIINSNLRPKREADEEDIMTKEVLNYGHVFLSMPPTTRINVGWKELRKKRIYARDQAAGLLLLSTDDESILAIKERKEEEVMLKEIDNYGQIFTFGQTVQTPLQLSDLKIDEFTFDPKMATKRPAGWDAVRRNRIAVKEGVLHVPAHTTVTMKQARERQEEQAMIQEIANYELFHYGTPGDTPLIPSSIILTDKNFDPKDETKRPYGWKELRARRIYYKDRASKPTTDNTRDNITLQRIMDEEKEMILECQNYGHMLDIRHNTQNALKTADISLNSSNFDPNVPNRRPREWTELKLKRVLYKERTAGYTDDNRDNNQALRRPHRLIEEEDLMVNEYKTYGKVFDIESSGHSLSSSTIPLAISGIDTSPSKYDPAVTSVRPDGWNILRSQRWMAKECILSIDQLSSHDILNKENQEEEFMKKEIVLYNQLLKYGGPGESIYHIATDIHITATNFNATSANLRPPGWEALKLRRVLIKESIAHIDEGDSDHNKRIEAEEKAMINEVLQYRSSPSESAASNVFDFGIVQHTILDRAPLMITSVNFSPQDRNKRPQGWTELRHKRVYEKERASGIKTLEDDSSSNNNNACIKEARMNREMKEEALMIEEVEKYGCVFTTKAPVSSAYEISDLIINTATYDVSDPMKRPVGWHQVRRQRVVLKETAAGVSPHTILSLRKQREDEEEVLMQYEVEKYGHVLKLKPIPTVGGHYDESRRLMEEEDMLNEAKLYGCIFSYGQPIDTPILQQDFLLSSEDFSSPRWKQVLTQRVEIKENILKSVNIPVNRTLLLHKEEKVMLQECESYGHPFLYPNNTTTGTHKSPLELAKNLNLTASNFDPNDPSHRPPEWKELKLRRVLAKESISHLHYSINDLMRQQHLYEEEDEMVHEHVTYGHVFSLQPTQRNPLSFTPSDLTITSMNFDPVDESVRPRGWNELRTQRVIAKEYAASVDPSTVTQFRPKREEAEEKLMVNEVINYGYVFAPGNTLPLRNTGLSSLTAGDFDKIDPSRRSSQWNYIHMMRVYAKDDIDRISGLSEQEIVDKRNSRNKEEQATMLSEMKQYGMILKLSIGASSLLQLYPSITTYNFDPYDSNKRPYGWNSVLNKRAYARELIELSRARQVPPNLDQLRVQKQQEEDYYMCQEVTNYGNILTFTSGTDSLIINDITYDPLNPLKRPRGWTDIRHQRVQAREMTARSQGNTDDNIITLTMKRHAEEEEYMMEEVRKFGTVLHIQPDNYLIIDGTNFVPHDITKRPTGWASTRIERVLAKEALDRKQGMKESEITAKRNQRKQEEEDLMVKEIALYGHILSVESNNASSIASGLLNTPTITQMIITEETFDPNDIVKRPSGWYEVRYKRVEARVRNDKNKMNNNNNNSTTNTISPAEWMQKESEEEAIMIQEVLIYGNVLSTIGTISTTNQVVSLMTCNEHTMNLNDINSRPPGWKELRDERIQARDAKNNITSSSAAGVIYKSKVGGMKATNTQAAKDKQEDALMLKEKEVYGHPLALGAPSRTTLRAQDLIINEVTYDRDNSSMRPYGWYEVRKNRILEKEKAANVDMKTLAMMRPKRIEEEEREMMREVDHYGVVLPIETVTATDFIPNPVEFDPQDLKKRPQEWLPIRYLRVQEKEVAFGVNTNQRLLLRPIREEKEEESMLGELACYNKLFHMEYEPAAGYSHTLSSSHIPNWTQAVLKRVLAKESTLDKKDHEIYKMRPQRIEEESTLMFFEKRQYGTPLMSESTGYNSVQVHDITINTTNFIPADTTIRPTGWDDTKLKRVMEKEMVAGIQKQKIHETREQFLQNEDEVMVHEIDIYGILLSSDQPLRVSALDASGLDITNKPHYRPAGWDILRNQRILAKDMLAGQSNTVFHQARQLQLEQSEDSQMLKEFQLYGVVFDPLIDDEHHKVTSHTDTHHQTSTANTKTRSFPDILINKRTYDHTDPKKRPQGWTEVRQQRLQAREVVAAKTKRTSFLTKESDYDKEEEKRMMAEVKKYGNILGVGSRANPSNSVQAMDLVINKSTFNHQTNQRPYGWIEVKGKRIYAREQKARMNKTSESVISSQASQRDQKEENLMCEEIANYGLVFQLSDPVQASDIILNETTYDKKNPTKRPIGWSILKKKRVLMRLAIERRKMDMNNAVDEKKLDDLYIIYEKEEETAMMEEALFYGTLLGIAGPLSKTVGYPADVIVHESTYDVSNPLKRPQGWVDQRYIRLWTKEEIESKRGITKSILLDNRPNTLLNIEKAMQQNIVEYGRLLMLPLRDPTAVDPVTNPALLLQLDTTNFDPTDPDIRPNGWNELKKKRVMIKEQTDRLLGLSEETIRERHDAREKMEEKLMIEEVLKYASNYIVSDRSLTRQSMSISQTPRGRTVSRDRVRSLTASIQTDGQIRITAENFDPNDPSKRPDGWIALRNKRVIVKEQIDRLGGIDEDLIAVMRDDRELEEEELMLAEVAQFGEPLGMKKYDKKNNNSLLHMNNTIEMITNENFNPRILNKRPKGWNELRMKRIMLKEHVDRLNGIDESTILEYRPEREVEEEIVMLEEVDLYGKVLGIGETAPTTTTTATTTATSSTSTPHKISTIRDFKPFIKEQFDRMISNQQGGGGVGGDISTIADNIKNKQKDDDRRKSKALVLNQLTSGDPRESAMTARTSAFSKLILEPIQTLEITPENYDPDNPKIRPPGWEAVRTRRIYKREQLDRLRGVTDAMIMQRRAAREKEEEEMMMKEVAAYGNVVGIGGLNIEDIKNQNRRASQARRPGGGKSKMGTQNNTTVTFEKLDITKDNFDPNDPEKRPPGWTEIRKKRVYKKEQLDRLRGVPETTITRQRPQREQEEEEIMLREVAQYGNVVGIGGIKKTQESLEELKELEVNFDPEEFDLNTNKRPKGWAAVKLRRVYMKEWKDRKDGLDEDEIMEKRYGREQEVEQEMIQEMSVNGRIRAFERAIQRNKANNKGFTKGFQQSLENYKKGVIANNVLKKQPTRKANTQSIRASLSKIKTTELSKIINETNQNLENLTDKITNYLQDTGNSRTGSPLRSSPIHESGGGTSPVRYGTSTGPPPLPPRIVAPRAIPLGRKFGSNNSPERLDLSRMSEPGRMSEQGKMSERGRESMDSLGELKKFSPRIDETSDLHVSKLGINMDNFDRTQHYARPSGWSAMKYKRLSMFEDKARQQGIDDEIIALKRNDMKEQIESDMVDEASRVLQTLKPRPIRETRMKPTPRETPREDDNLITGRMSESSNTTGNSQKSFYPGYSEKGSPIRQSGSGSGQNPLNMHGGSFYMNNNTNSGKGSPTKRDAVTHLAQLKENPLMKSTNTYPSTGGGNSNNNSSRRP